MTKTDFVYENIWGNGCEHFFSVFFTTEPDGYVTTRCKKMRKGSAL